MHKRRKDVIIRCIWMIKIFAKYIVMFSYFSEEKPEETVKKVVEEIVAASAPEETADKPEETPASAPEETPAKAEDVVVVDKQSSALDKCTPGFSCTIM